MPTCTCLPGSVPPPNYPCAKYTITGIGASSGNFHSFDISVNCLTKWESGGGAYDAFDWCDNNNNYNYFYNLAGEDCRLGTGTIAQTGPCQVGYNCSGNDCVLVTDGSGAYATIDDCQAVCGTFDIVNGNILNSKVYGTPGLFPSLSAAEAYYPNTPLPPKPPYGSANLCPPCPVTPCPNPDVDLSPITVNKFSGTCDASSNPVYTTITVTVIKGTEDSQTLLFNDLAEIQGRDFCNLDIPAAPDGWLLRPEYLRPQGIYQFAEIDGSGLVIGSPHYKITVPHHINSQPTSGPPNYVRGNWEYIYVLNDNSKLTMHTLDEATAESLLSYFQAYLDPAMTTKAYTSKSGIAVRESPIQQKTVRCNFARFYITGATTGKPTWRVRF